MSDSTDGVLVWRPRSVQILNFLYWGALASIPSTPLVYYGVRSLLLAPMLLVVLTTYVCMFRRSMRIGFVADRRRIRVVNFWRTYEIAWDDVVEVRDKSTLIGVAAQTTLGFVLHSGRTVPVEATSFPGKHGRGILKHLRHFADPYHVPVNIDPPRKTWWWGETFQPMPYEDRTTVPHPRKPRR